MKDLSVSVETLAKKVGSLSKAYSDSAQTIAGLNADKLQMKAKAETLNAEIERLKEENKLLKMASAIRGNEESVTESKRRISQIVREIDRCIALLND